MVDSVCNSMDNEVSARAVAARLRQYKGTLTSEVEWLLRSRLRKLMPRGYTFMPKASAAFWSPLLEDIIDIDLKFAGPSHRHAFQASVRLEAANMMYRAAGRVMQTTLKYRVLLDVPGAPEIEEEHRDWAMCLEMIQVTSATTSRTLHVRTRY
jgi:hypothetical protein